MGQTSTVGKTTHIAWRYCALIGFRCLPQKDDQYSMLELSMNHSCSFPRHICKVTLSSQFSVPVLSEVGHPRPVVRRPWSVVRSPSLVLWIRIPGRDRVNLSLRNGPKDMLRQNIRRCLLVMQFHSFQ